MEPALPGKSRLEFALWRHASCHAWPRPLIEEIAAKITCRITVAAGKIGTVAMTPIYQSLGTKGETGMKKSGSQKGKSPSQLIDAKIKELGDWRGKMLSRLRTLVKEADPEVVEEWKWRGVPVWSHDGLICTGETYKNVVKMTFAKGAALKDPSGLFNSSLDEHKACHRLPRGREDRRGGVENSRSRRREPEQVQSPKLIHGIKHFPWDPARSHRLGSIIESATEIYRQFK